MLLLSPQTDLSNRRYIGNKAQTRIMRSLRHQRGHKSIENQQTRYNTKLGKMTGRGQWFQLLIAVLSIMTCEQGIFPNNQNLTPQKIIIEMVDYSGTLEQRLQKVQILIEQMAKAVNKMQRLAASGQEGAYNTSKQQALELSVEINSLTFTGQQLACLGLVIESEFEGSERRNASSEMVFESFNAQVAKLRQLITGEDQAFKIQQASSQQHEFSQDIVREQRRRETLAILNVAEYGQGQATVEQVQQIQNIITGLNALQRDQLELLQKHEEGLQHTYVNVVDAVEDSRQAGEEVKTASKHKFKGLKFKLGLVFTGIGAAVGAVLGLGVGAVAGGAGGAVLGTTIGTKLDRLAKKKYQGIQFEGPK